MEGELRREVGGGNPFSDSVGIPMVVLQDENDLVLRANYIYTFILKSHDALVLG